MSMTNVMLYLSGGSLDPYKSTFIVPPRMLEEKRFEKRKKVEVKMESYFSPSISPFITKFFDLFFHIFITR